MIASFDYKQVELEKNKLDGIFKSFYTQLADIDEKYSSAVSADSDCAIFLGERAKSAISRWNSFSFTFNAINNEFDSLISLIEGAAKGYEEWEEEATGIATSAVASTSSYYGGGGRAGLGTVTQSIKE